jgi:cyclic pyranopterin phosphate synthase
MDSNSAGEAGSAEQGPRGDDHRADDHQSGDRRSGDPRVDRRRSVQLGRSGRPRMARIGAAAAVPHRAIAEAEVAVAQETLSAIVDGTVPRGDVLGVAELAGVLAAKRTAELIPLVHSTPLSELLVVATPERAAGVVRIKAETGAIAATGVEMEALTAASVAALTLYDMVRDVDPEAEIRGVRLLSAVAEDGPEWNRDAGPSAARGPGRGPGRSDKPRAGRMAGRVPGRQPGPRRGR